MPPSSANEPQATTQKTASCCGCCKEACCQRSAASVCCLYTLTPDQTQVDAVMRRYPSYLSWDVDQELKPRIHDYSNRLGNKALAKMICASPPLLHNTVSKVDMLSAWLQSLGVQAPHRIVISHPVILSLKLKTLQEKVNELQLMGVPKAYIGRMSQRYPVIHLSSSQQTQQMLTFFAQVFEVPEASDELLDILLSTPDSTDRLWRASFAAQQGVYTYLQSLGGNKQSLIRAFCSSVFTIAP